MPEEAINTGRMQVPDKCSLYRAARYVAFQELPYKDYLAKVVHPKRHVFSQYSDYNEENGVTIFAFDNVWETEGDEKSFEQACEVLAECLYSGELVSYGRGSNKHKRMHDYPALGPIPLLYESHKFTKSYLLDRYFWIDYDIYWVLSMATPKLFGGENMGGVIFREIEIPTINLMNLFDFGLKSNDNKKKKGRPPGAVTYDDNFALGYMYALVSENKITPYEAARTACHTLKLKGASEPSIIDRLRTKYRKKFGSEN